MSNYIYRFTPLDIIPENSSFITRLSSGDDIYLLPNTHETGYLVGEWFNDGSLVNYDETIFNEIKSLGNIKEETIDESGNVIETVTGIASDSIQINTYQGHLQRKVQVDPVYNEDEIPPYMPEYPSNNQPFSLRITRTYITDDGYPEIPWGWTVEMLSNDPNRDITARAIGVYENNGNYLYTTGAFVLMDFDDIDIHGNPVVVQRYASVCPVGQRKANPETVYFKLLLGSAPEGSWNFNDLNEGAVQTKLFWEFDKTYPIYGEWVDSGQTVDSMAGTVTIIQDNSQFSVNDLIRINNVEMTVDSLWTGTGLVLLPYTASAVDDIVYVWR